MPDGSVPALAPPASPDCCLDLPPDTACDVLDFTYRLTHQTSVHDGDRTVVVPVDVVITARLERCPGPMALGDLVYTTTLLPGEKVRLFTTDRKSQFVYDSDSKVSYRNQYASEERTFLASMSHDLSNLNTKDSTSPSSSGGGSAGGGGVLGVIGAVLTGGLSLIGGSHNGGTTRDFAHQLSQHAEASTHRAESATRALASISVGEVQTRTHSQGESEDHFESSSRELANPNRCHAISFSFYQVNKTQTVRFTLLSISRRVNDPVGPAAIGRVVPAIGATSVIPHLVLSTDKDRLAQESTDRRSAVQAATSGAMTQQVMSGDMSADQAEAVASKERDGQRLAQSGQDSVSGNPPIVANDMSDIAAFAKVVGFSGGSFGTSGTQQPTPAPDGPEQPWPASVRQQALDQVAEDLITAGLLDPSTLTVAPGLQKELSFEKRSSLPTGGVLVKGCLDECNVCEPELGKLYELEVERRTLENALLQKQIDLLEKSQEYRCCPDPDQAPAPV
jgi:hypothetical protein